MELKPAYIIVALLVGYLICDMLNSQCAKSSFAPIAAAPAPKKKVPRAAARRPVAADCVDCDKKDRGIATAVATSLAPRSEDNAPEMLEADGILQGQNFIKGLPGTMSGSLRNANMQIRPDPVIARRPVGMFNNSTIPSNGQLHRNIF